MKKISSYEISEKVELKFNEVTGLNLSVIESQNVKPVNSASFTKFQVNDICNLKLLALQGLKGDIELIPQKKYSGIGKKVFMLMVQGQRIKSFYQCYAVEKMPTVKTEPEKKGLFSKKPQAPKTAESLFAPLNDKQIAIKTDVAQFIEEQKNFNKSLLDIVMELKKRQ